MPDTIRTLADLNAIFPDNTGGEVAPQDVRDLVASMLPHAEIGSGAKSAITLGTGYQALDFTVAGASDYGFTVNTTSKWIAGTPVTGKYRVQLEIIFKGAQNQTYDFSVFRNPDGTPAQLNRLDCQARPTAAADIRNVSVSAYVSLTATDKLQAAVRCNGQTFELLRGGMRVDRVGVM